MNKKINTKDLTILAIMAALMCVSAYISIPLPFTAASLTAQTLVVNLIALLLTPKQAMLTVLIYILLGLIGLPVFSGGVGGAQKLFGPTGGYIFSWIFAVGAISLLKGKKYNFIRYSIITIIVGMPLIYIIGSIYMKYVTGMEWKATLLAAVVPFIPLDILKCLLAVVIVKPLQSVIKSDD